MTLAVQYPELHTSTGLIDTPYGFPAHSLNLSPRQLKLHGAVMDEVMNDGRVGEVFRAFDAFDDDGTKMHSFGVAWIGVATAIKMGIDERALPIVGRGAVGHDVGKAERKTQRAIRSPRTFGQDPTLRQAIMPHPVRSSFVLKRLGFGNNEALMAGGHHGFQEDPYGMTGFIPSFAEADGFVPPTHLMTQILAGADVSHSLSVHPSDSGRNYLFDENVGPQRATAGVESLNVPAVVQDATLEVLGFK